MLTLIAAHRSPGSTMLWVGFCTPRRGLGSAVVVGLVAFLGASSKLPFAVAAVAVWFAWATQTRATQSRMAGSAIAAGVGVHLILRAAFAPFRGQVGATESVFSDPAIWLSIPRLVGKGTEALLTFPADAMQSLSWVLFGPWSTSDWLGLAIAILVLSFLSYRRDWPGLVDGQAHRRTARRAVLRALTVAALFTELERGFHTGRDRSVLRKR